MENKRTIKHAQHGGMIGRYVALTTRSNFHRETVVAVLVVTDIIGENVLLRPICTYHTTKDKPQLYTQGQEGKAYLVNTDTLLDHGYRGSIGDVPCSISYSAHGILSVIGEMPAEFYKNNKEQVREIAKQDMLTYRDTMIDVSVEIGCKLSQQEVGAYLARSARLVYLIPEDQDQKATEPKGE